MSSRDRNLSTPSAVPPAIAWVTSDEITAPTAGSRHVRNVPKAASQTRWVYAYDQYADVQRKG